MKKLFFLLAVVLSSFIIVSCDDGGDSNNVNPLVKERYVLYSYDTDGKIYKTLSPVYDVCKYIKDYPDILTDATSLEDGGFVPGDEDSCKEWIRNMLINTIVYDMTTESYEQIVAGKLANDALVIKYPGVMTKAYLYGEVDPSVDKDLRDISWADPSISWLNNIIFFREDYDDLPKIEKGYWRNEAMGACLVNLIYFKHYIFDYPCKSVEYFQNYDRENFHPIWTDNTVINSGDFKKWCGMTDENERKEYFPSFLHDINHGEGISIWLSQYGSEERNYRLLFLSCETYMVLIKNENGEIWNDSDGDREMEELPTHRYYEKDLAIIE